MSYRIYTTPALILETYPSGERDKTVLAYSRDLGLVYVRAGGVRKLESKLRYALEPFSLTELSLVRGKQGWRLTSAAFERNLYKELAGNSLDDSARLTVLLNTTKLLRRLVVGELAEPALFEEFIGLLRSLSDRSLSGEELEGLELLLVLRLLNRLGYVGEGVVREVEGSGSESLFLRVRLQKEHLVGVINDSLNRTQL